MGRSPIFIDVRQGQNDGKELVMAKSREFYVSGIIQILVKAPTAEEAVKRATKQQDNLMNKYSSLNISVENICESTGPTVSLYEATDLDTEYREDLARKADAK